VEPAIAPVALPPPNVRFVGRPCRYPEAAIQGQVEGRVLLRIAFGDDGTVLSVKVEESSGSAVLDAEAVRTARMWRAVPEAAGGKVWATEVLKPIIFRIPRS
jgi:protein TonB